MSGATQLLPLYALMAWKKQLFRYLQLRCYFRNCIVFVIWYL
jgi:hypothetical protein